MTESTEMKLKPEMNRKSLKMFAFLCAERKSVGKFNDSEARR